MLEENLFLSLQEMGQLLDEMLGLTIKTYFNFLILNLFILTFLLVIIYFMVMKDASLTITIIIIKFILLSDRFLLIIFLILISILVTQLINILQFISIAFLEY